MCLKVSLSLKVSKSVEKVYKQGGGALCALMTSQQKWPPSHTNIGVILTHLLQMTTILSAYM